MNHATHQAYPALRDLRHFHQTRRVHRVQRDDLARTRENHLHTVHELLPTQHVWDEHFDVPRSPGPVVVVVAKTSVERV